MIKGAALIIIFIVVSIKTTFSDCDWTVYFPVVLILGSSIVFWKVSFLMHGGQ